MANSFIKKISDLIDWGLSLYDSIMKATLRLPFARLERDEYLRSVLKHLPQDEIESSITTSPSDVMEAEKLSDLAKKEANKNIWFATLTSFVTALPTNWLMWPAIVIDLVLFQIQVFLISQKLLYLYGEKDLALSNLERKEKANRLMLIVSTIMIGKQKLSRAAKTATGMLVKQLIERYGTRLLSKFIIFNTLRQIAKWMGISFTKAMLLDSINLLIPITCAAISALVSYLLIAPMAKKLHKHLKEDLHSTASTKA
ncbi:MAG: hypothetical protein MJZ33_13590 [Paludibacteraceae bacterium]|nr:hypothetical protein [Paludibacteraceae bacterium]